MRILDSRIEVDDCTIYCRHNEHDAARANLLFIHGIGESGLCFLEAFHSSLNEKFNIIIPDLPGFGLSAPASNHDYSFEKQVSRLYSLADRFGASQAQLVGHSMGADIGTLLCQQHPQRVLSFVNIEGNLTVDNRYIVDQVLQADTEHRFEDWLRRDFAGEQIVSLCHQWPSTVRYLASLNLCQSRAFLQSAREMDRLLKPANQPGPAVIGSIYQELKMSRIFCWGSDSLGDSAREFLDRSGLEQKEFAKSFHWVMLDQPVAFYNFLAAYLD